MGSCLKHQGFHHSNGEHSLNNGGFTKQKQWWSYQHINSHIFGFSNQKGVIFSNLSGFNHNWMVLWHIYFPLDVWSARGSIERVTFYAWSLVRSNPRRRPHSGRSRPLWLRQEKTTTAHPLVGWIPSGSQTQYYQWRFYCNSWENRIHFFHCQVSTTREKNPTDIMIFLSESSSVEPSTGLAGLLQPYCT